MITQAQKLNKAGGQLGKIRNYTEVVEFLGGLRYADYDAKVIERMKTLDKMFDNVSTKLDIVLVGGTNGKSSAIHFASKLLKEEGFKVGAAYSSHTLNHTERFVVDFTAIASKNFTDTVNEVINAVEVNKIDATAFEILTISSLVYFQSQKTDIVLLEVGVGGRFDATNFCEPKISAVTRIAQDHVELLGEDLDEVTAHMLEIARPDNWFISAEQSKIRLQKMKAWIEGERGAKWAMPIRKLAYLPYLYEQLYGRIASLGERIAQIYVEDIKGKFSPFLRGNLLATQKGQRGRPTLEAKRQAELNPIKTLKGFWTEQFDLLKSRFELLDQEKPSILLDTAHNLDAFANLFLGIRLLHYQRPLKGLALVIGLDGNTDAVETLKLARYLLKKVSGQIIFVNLPGKKSSHDVQELANKAKELNIKAKGYTSFEQGFQAAKSVVDQRDGLICITGANEMVSQYWKNRGTKKI